MKTSRLSSTRLGGSHMGATTEGRWRLVLMATLVVPWSRDLDVNFYYVLRRFVLLLNYYGIS